MPWLFDDQPPLYADYLSFPPRVTQSKGEVSDEMGDGDVHGACRCSCRYYGIKGNFANFAAQLRIRRLSRRKGGAAGDQRRSLVHFNFRTGMLSLLPFRRFAAPFPTKVEGMYDYPPFINPCKCPCIGRY